MAERDAEFRRRSPVNMLEILDYFWEKRGILLIVLIVAAIVSAIVSLVLPQVYESSATMIVTPPTYSTKLTPEVQSVQFYAEIARSDELIAEVMREAGITNITLEDMKENVNVATVREKYGPQVKYSPLILLQVLAPTAKQAQHIATIWAELFTHKCCDIIEQDRNETIEFIDQEFNGTESKLRSAEDLYTTRSIFYKQSMTRLTNEWEKRIAELQGRWNIDRMEKEHTAVKERTANFKAELVRLDYDLLAAKKKLDQARQQLATQSERIVLEKAISQDALWLLLSTTAEKTAPKDLGAVRLTDQEINPVYIELSETVENATVDYAVLSEKKTIIARELERAQKEADALLQTIEDKKFELGTMQRQEALEQAELKIKEETEIEQLKRDVDKFKETHLAMAEYAEAARISRNEKPQYLRVATWPVEPQRRLSPKRAQIVVVSVVAVLCATLFILAADYVGRKTASSLSSGSSR